MKSSYLLFILLGIAVLLTFAVTHSSGGLDTDSCNYAVVAKEILRTNQWLKLYDPVSQGPFYYHFPLAIWITAVFFKFFGVSAFVAKLFSMFSNLILIIGIFYFGKLIKNYWVGFFAGLFFLFTNHVVRLAMQCRMDIPVSLFITLAVFSFILAQRYSRWYYLFFGLFSCLAIFTKDVVGLAPLAVVSLYLLLRLKWKEFFHPLFIAGLAVTFLPVLFWIRLDQNTLFQRWYYWNFLHLLASPSFNVPWYYYIQAIFSKYFYFLPFVIYGGYLGIREVRNNKKDDVLVLLIWTIIFPLAFSFGRQKLHYFILPMYPATSLLAGLAFEKIFPEIAKVRIAKTFKVILIITSLVLLMFPIAPGSKRFNEASEMFPVIDGILKPLPEYEFIVYKYDSAAILFYSRQLTGVKSFNDIGALENALSGLSLKPRFCFISEDDFGKLNFFAKESCRVILKYKQRLLLLNRETSPPIISLP